MKHDWEDIETTKARHGADCECPICSPLWYIEEGGEG